LAALTLLALKARAAAGGSGADLATAAFAARTLLALVACEPAGGGGAAFS